MSIYSSDEVDTRAKEILLELERRLIGGTNSPWDRTIDYGFRLHPVGVNSWNCSVEIKERREKVGWSDSRGTGYLYLSMGNDLNRKIRGDKIKGGVDFDFVEEFMVSLALRQLQGVRDLNSGRNYRVSSEGVLDNILNSVGGFKDFGARSIRREENGDKWSFVTLLDPDRPMIQLTVNMGADRMGLLVDYLVDKGFLLTAKD